MNFQKVTLMAFFIDYRKDITFQNLRIIEFNFLVKLNEEGEQVVIINIILMNWQMHMCSDIDIFITLGNKVQKSYTYILYTCNLE